MGDQKFFLEVRVANGSITNPPHVFIVLTDEFGNEQGYGFAPKVDMDLWGPGKIYDDTKHRYDHSDPYEITAKQYEDLVSYVYQRQQNPGIYEAWDRNCVDFVSKAMRYAGIDDLPNGPLTHPIELAWLPKTRGMTKQLDALIADLQGRFGRARTTISPLVLDLDGDGIDTLGTSAGIHFDHDGNGFSETTGWVGKDDALLVWDRNGNDRIDDGSELFGNNTSLATGGKAANGFVALAEIDSNRDGRVDAQDASFSQLRLWLDTDANADVSDGELRALAAASVQSLSLTYRTQRVTDDQGNQLLQVGSYTKADGSAQAMVDVWFAADRARTVDTRTIAVSDAIAALPDLPGFGNVPSLHQAIARDASGKLLGLVRTIVAEQSPATQRTLMDEFLMVWTGSNQHSVDSRGRFFGDGRKLYVLEAFLGEGFWQGEAGIYGSKDPGSNASELLDMAYENLADFYLGIVQPQTSLRTLYATVALAWDATDGAFRADVSATVDSLKSAYAADPVSGDALIQEFGRSLERAGGDFGKDVLRALRAAAGHDSGEFNVALTAMGMHHIRGTNASDVIRALDGRRNLLEGRDGADYLTGGSWDDRLEGGAGNDSLTGGAGNDWLFGGDGDDQLFGGDGDDLLSLGPGNDKAEGGNGNDTYLVHKGGAITVTDYGEVPADYDRVQFLDWASTEVNAVERRGNDLALKFAEGEQLAVKWYFSSRHNRIEQFTFADGVSWDDLAIKTRAMTIGLNVRDNIAGYDEAGNRMAGLDGNDYLTGGAKDDLLDGGNGDDYMQGRAGDDVLLGGAGNDSLWGEAGNDRLDGGDGNDYLVGGDGNDTIFAGDGDDAIHAGAGDDWIDTGVGNDTVDGGTGNDTYVLHGQGTVTIRDNEWSPGRQNIVQFIDVASTDIAAVERQLDTLVLKYANGGLLRIPDYFIYSSIARFQFGDGVTWGNVAIKERAQTWGTSAGDSIIGYDQASNRMVGLGGDDTLTGGALADLLDGGIGNDTFRGKAGNDALFGGDGNDRLDGGTGNNLLDGGSGNDTLNGDDGNELFIGGAGDDIIDTGRGADVIVFNRGDGHDTVLASYGQDNTHSLGKGISYADLRFSRTGNDLVVAAGIDDSITLKDWYAGPHKHSIAQLQFVDAPQTGPKTGQGSGSVSLPSEDGAPDPASDQSQTATGFLCQPRVLQYDFETAARAIQQIMDESHTRDNLRLSNESWQRHQTGNGPSAFGGIPAWRAGMADGAALAIDYSLQAMAAAPQLGAALGDSRFGLFSQPLMTSGGPPTGATSFW